MIITKSFYLFWFSKVEKIMSNFFLESEIITRFEDVWRVVIHFFAIKSRGGKCNEDLDGAYDPTLSR